MTNDLLPCPFCGSSDNLTIDFVYKEDWCVECDNCHVGQHALWPSKEHAIQKWNTRANKPAEVDGDTSDGYHTFNELYEHRHALFAALLRCYPTEAWKSKKHDDGSMFDGWFIAGIHTPEGNATYHIPMRLWDTFEAHEVDTAPKWDGHTPADVITRIGHLATGKGGGASKYNRRECFADTNDGLMAFIAYGELLSAGVDQGSDHIVSNDETSGSIPEPRSTDQQKTAEPSRDVQAALDWLYEKATAGCTEFTDQLPDNYNTVFMALKQPAAPTQIDAGELEKAIADLQSRLNISSEITINEGMPMKVNGLSQLSAERLLQAASAHLAKSKGGV